MKIMSIVCRNHNSFTFVSVILRLHVWQLILYHSNTSDSHGGGPELIIINHNNLAMKTKTWGAHGMVDVWLETQADTVLSVSDCCGQHGRMDGSTLSGTDWAGWHWASVSKFHFRQYIIV
jgi:hypothetical protein